MTLHGHSADVVLDLDATDHGLLKINLIKALDLDQEQV
jgi:hypothetical protein